MRALSVDDRYRGAHGIGRYAREVLPRLGMPWHPLGLSGSPHTPWDALRRVPDSAREGVVYSPGYGALARAGRQVLTIHDLIQLQLPWPGRAKFLAYYAGPVRHVVRRAGLILTVSQTSAAAIAEWVDDDDVRIVDAGNGCSPAFTVSGGSGHGDHGAGDPGSDPYVVFVGNLRRHKNLDVVLRALRGAAGVRLRAVLPVREVAAAAARARELGVSERVALLSGLDDEALADLYRGAAATVMPSTIEGFGLPALESIACGVPVVHWRGCAAVSEVVGGRGWALESATDAEEWSHALRAAAGQRRRVSPPVGAHDWDRVAATVTQALRGIAI
ncbi:glycosyltransferase [Microbacterium flavum]|uniref:Glycosyltransferase n=1 Tax=Microbacterium flavum TaxID=415216 RepID=A0ABS5XSV9_9MICO|nr:glycosyltransferase [Microbacterium flavum]MBT8797609.1 glycosyltransferase [Microbacterium flavum]